jgi:hypothetical protein
MKNDVYYKYSEAVVSADSSTGLLHRGYFFHRGRHPEVNNEHDVDTNNAHRNQGD